MNDLNSLNNTTSVAAAGFLSRSIAHLVDLTLLLFFCWLLHDRLHTDVESIIIGSLSKIEVFPEQKTLQLAFLFLALFISLIYFVVLESSPLRATLGKLLFGLQVVTPNLYLATFGKITVRNIARIVCLSSLGFGYLLAILTKNKQALHDIIAGTVVIAHPLPKIVRSILGIVAVFACCSSSYLFFLNKNLSFLESEKDLKISILPSDFEQQQDAISYIALDKTSTPLATAYARLDQRLVKGSVGQIKRTRRLRIAFFTEQLGTEQLSELELLDDLIRPTANIDNPIAAVLVTITFPEGSVTCDTNRIESLSITINPTTLTNLKKDYSIPIVHQLNPLNIETDFGMKIDCSPYLTDQANLALRLKTHLPELKELTESFLNINISTNMISTEHIKRVKISDLPSAVAFWSPQKSRIELDLYNEQLTRLEFERIIGNKTILSVTNKKPTMQVIFNHSVAGQEFARDLVTSYSIKFLNLKLFNKELSASESTHQVNFTKPQLPDTLVGRIKDGQHLTGRVSGLQKISDKNSIILEWDIAFNAPLIIVE